VNVANPTETEVRTPETDHLLKAQMAVADVFLAYWKHLFGAVLALLAGVFLVGQWSDHQKGVQRESYDALAAIDRTLQPATPEAVPPTPEALRQAAEQFEGVAKGASGPVAAEAWMKAAVAWREVGDKERHLAALGAASALELEGALAYGTRMAHAQALLGAGRTDEGLTALRAHAGTFTGFYAEQALLTLVRAQADANREADARQTLNEFKLRFGAQAQAASVKELETRLGIATATEAPAAGAPAAGAPAGDVAQPKEAAPKPAEGAAPAPLAAPSGTGTGG
jgi:predicted negative regulator of RcsB-dependent stress response